MSKSKPSPENGMLIVTTNKKAYHDYQILEIIEAGMSLKGSEVKSIREGGVNLKDSYVRIIKNEVLLVGCHISPYSHSRAEEHDPTRDRKLLLHKKEIEKLAGKVRQKGLTLVPLKIYFRKGRSKLEIGLAKGKKLFDKREDIKAKEAKREIDRGLRGKNRA